ncbi:hypothetical protein, partial [Actinacidiphila soli]|uniref:hypothetical protein n=1 Tax=Actinacidiphila soli TaxID=2487275 RepID=UPI001F0C8AF4
ADHAEPLPDRQHRTSGTRPQRNLEVITAEKTSLDLCPLVSGEKAVPSSEDFTTPRIVDRGTLGVQVVGQKGDCLQDLHAGFVPVKGFQCAGQSLHLNICPKDAHCLREIDPCADLQCADSQGLLDGCPT